LILSFQPKLFLTGLALCGLLVALLLGHNQVDNRLTDQDLQTIEALLKQRPPAHRPAPQARSLAEEIARIRELVDAVFLVAPNLAAIPEHQSREPHDVVRNGGGVCYDRSRFIEKVLRADGLETRHVALYRRDEGQTIWRTLLTRDAISHAVTEVRTRAGWMLIDPVANWVATDKGAQPVSTLEIARSVRQGKPIRWPAGQKVPDFFNRDFVAVYGLYSRHGTFYPPFNRIPDVHYAELFDNLIE
jgi:transglutaminase-like putative cysteine protease